MRGWRTKRETSSTRDPNSAAASRRKAHGPRLQANVELLKRRSLSTREELVVGNSARCSIDVPRAEGVVETLHQVSVALRMHDDAAFLTLTMDALINGNCRRGCHASVR